MAQKTIVKIPDNALYLMPKQDQFLFGDAKYSAFVAGIGSGKTFAGCVKAILKARSGEPGVIVAPTFAMLRDVTQQTLTDLLNTYNQPYKLNKSDGVLEYSGARIYMRSGDRPDRLRGPNLNWAYLDEAALMREVVWKIIIGRLRIGRNPGAWITTTPAGFNWVYEYWVERALKKYTITHSTTRENIHLPAEYIEDLENTYTGEFAKQEIEGDFVAFEGLVYSEFSRNIHVIDNFDIPEHWMRVRGIDHGYTNPFVCLWGAIDEDGRLYIYDEYYKKKTLVRDHAETIKLRPNKAAWTVADHAAEANAQLNAAGINTSNAQKAVLDGIQRVTSRLKVQEDGKPRLYVTSNCINTIKEAGMYRWAEGRTGVNMREDPVKEYDHAMDTLRYMIMELDNKGFVYV